MDTKNIYQNIASRSSGDIYIGVVGPVRTGKSTFISRFMETLVIPNIAESMDKKRAIDEIPQSGDGVTIMTTQPKFIPAKACRVNLADKVSANVRLVDCVGYMVEGANTGEADGKKERMVKTPWSNEEIPFSKAAEIGTKKVIQEHSSIGIIVTSDGSITEIARPNYVEAEERCVAELKAINKPFVVVVNSTNSISESTIKLQSSLKNKYRVPVLAMDCSKLKEENIANIFSEILNEFPFEKIEVKMPLWLEVLPRDNSYIKEVIAEVSTVSSNMVKMGDYNTVKLFEKSENFEISPSGDIMLDKGTIVFEVVPKQSLFYKVLSEQAGVPIKNEFELVYNLKELAEAKKSYDQIKEAMYKVETEGYGIVSPLSEQMTLAEPEIVKQGNRYGVKLKASAPSLHIMKVDIETEVNPILGTEAQSEELVKNMMEKFESNPQALWTTNIFGKSLFELVNDGLKSKLTTMPIVAQQKMRKTLGRIVNEGKGGVICILL